MVSLIKLMQRVTTSFAVGLLVTLLAFQSLWLEMRFNVGFLIPIVMVVMLLASLLPKGRKLISKVTDKVGFIVIYLLIIILLGAKYGINGSQIIPAAILRELVSLPGVSLDQYNQIILGLFLLGLTSFYFKLGVSSGLIWLLLSQIEVQEIIYAMGSISWRYLVIALLLAVLAMPFSAYKWQPLLRAQGLEHSLKKLTGIYFIGLFFNNFLPSSIGGDVVRIYKSGKEMREYEKAAASVIVERLLATLGLVFLGLIALTVSFAMGNYLLIPFLIIGGTGLAVAVIFGVAFYWLPESQKEQPGKKIWLQKLYQLIHAVKQYKGKKNLLLRVIWLSVCFQVIVVILNYYLFLALGKPVTLLACALYIPIISALAMVPLSINGLGVREGAYVYFFAQIGVDAALAVTASLLFFLVVIVASLPGGVLFALEGERKIMTRLGQATGQY